MKVFKNKKQRIVAVFLSLVFAFMLVPFTDAYAGAVYISTGHTYNFTGTYNEEEYNISYTFNSSNNDNIVFVQFKNCLSYSGVYAFSLSDFSVGYDVGGDYYVNKFAVSTTQKNFSTYFAGYSAGCLNSFCTVDNSSSSYYYSLDSYAGIPVYVYDGGGAYLSEKDFGKVLANLLNNGDSSGFDCTYVDSNSEGGYSNEIGALKNVSRNTLYPDHANNVDSVFWRFRYASKTTKGYSVKTSGSKIRVYESVTYYKRSDDSVYSESPKVLVGEFDATGLQFDMDVNEAFNKTTSEADSQYIANAWTILTKQIVRNDRIYLQVVDANGNCGDYLRIGGHADNASNATDNPQTVVDEDGNEVSEENGGYSKDDTDGDVGTSIDGDLDTADDDANSKPEEKENIGDSLDHAIATIRSLIDMIRHIPEIISILFSFLPPWCLSVVALGFVALVVLIAYKLIRG